MESHLASLGSRYYICNFSISGSKNDYRKTYIASYKESNTTRLRIAEHLRKLPMSFLIRKTFRSLLLI